MKDLKRTKLLKTFKKEALITPELSSSNTGLLGHLIQHTSSIAVRSLGIEETSFALEFASDRHVIGFYADAQVV